MNDPLSDNLEAFAMDARSKLAPACRYNPFDGDFGDVGNRELADKIVKFRFAHDCCLCPATIKAGEVGRSLTMLWADGSPAPIATYRYCNVCTRAMAKGISKGAWNALEDRPVRRGRMSAANCTTKDRPAD